MPTQVSSTNQKQEKIYQHLESCVQQEPPEKVVRRYQRLFVQGTSYEEPDIRELLEQLAKADEADDTGLDFSSFINRCCYVAINQWLKESAETQHFINELVKIFEEPPSSLSAQTLLTRRIRERTIRFNKSNYLIKMQRLRSLLTTNEAIQKDKSQPFSSILGRYPLLFQDSICQYESYSETTQTLKNFQKQKEHDFALALANYITNQVRSSRLAKHFDSLTTKADLASPAPNPTLLKEPELIATLQHFISGVEGKSTYQDLAKRFLNHSSKADTFKTYKKDIYEYLTSSVSIPYGRRQFKKRMATHIKHTLKEWDAHKPNEQLTLRLANSLLKFLIVKSHYNIDHYFDLDLVTNLGPPQTIGMLLKILFLSDKIYPYLTSRFAILYDHYETTPRENVHWLFKSLETLNIALTIHRSAIDVSYWRSANSL